MTASPAASSLALPSVSFVIPVRDDADRLARCLDSIRANVYDAPVEIIVADNGSRDGSPRVAEAAGATVLELPGLSVAQLRNEAARGASGDLLALVDADHVIDPAWIEHAASTILSTGAAAAGALCLTPENGTWVQRAYDRLRSRVPGIRKVEWLGAGNLAIRREVFLQIGGFDVSLETCEDVDLCNRLRAAGHTLVSDDRMRNVHLGDPPTLRALFFSELWRGRDNLRVTLRGPLTLRALPSVLLPVVHLALIAVGLSGFVTLAWGGLRLSVWAAAGILGIAAARAAYTTANAQSWHPSHVAANLVVGLVYEAARALALIARATHHQRRGGAAR